MIPNIFVSSTIRDLAHLREALRDTVAELGYTPVLSEYGGVGFLPSASAEESCYVTVRQCHAAVAIIGKRYGTIGKDGVSITQNEFRIARAEGLPVFCLVDRELLAYKTIFDAQPSGGVDFPGMDSAPQTFGFLQEVMEAPTNNAILPFGDVSDARQLLKTQFAHLFAELLRQKFNPLTSDLRDVLSEIKTLRHELTASTKVDVQLPFLRAVRMMLDDRFSMYGGILKTLYPALENGVEDVLSSDTFDEFAEKATKHPIVHQTFDRPYSLERARADGIRTHTVSVPRWPLPPHSTGTIEFAVGDRVFLNDTALDYFRALHRELKRAVLAAPGADVGSYL